MPKQGWLPGMPGMGMPGLPPPFFMMPGQSPMMPMMPPDMFKMFENFAKHAEIIMKFQNTCM